MSESNQEPTRDEILASIRRIISEDDAPAEDEVAEEAPVAAAPEPEPMADLSAFDTPLEDEPMALEDDVLELTDRLDDPLDTIDTLGIDDLEVVAPPPPSFEAPEPAYPALDDDEPLVGQPASYSAASAFESLERSILMPGVGRTLEDVVRELLRPMLKAWLDEHLPSIVEAQVAAEVERIARLRR